MVPGSPTLCRVGFCVLISLWTIVSRFLFERFLSHSIELAGDAFSVWWVAELRGAMFDYLLALKEVRTLLGSRLASAFHIPRANKTNRHTFEADAYECCAPPCTSAHANAIASIQPLAFARYRDHAATRVTRVTHLARTRIRTRISLLHVAFRPRRVMQCSRRAS